MICLGVLFDTVTFTMSVTPACLRELKDDVLPQWLVKKSATKTELQSLIGELAFVCKCVRPGRLFLTRLLDTLRSLRRPHHRIKLTADFKKHLCWWLRFLRVYNGVSFIPTQLWFACFHVEFSRSVLSRFPAIHLLEALSIVVALRLWGRHWLALPIFVYCDNTAVVSSLNSGRVQDKLVAECLKGEFGFTRQRTSLSSALVILLVLTIVARIYLVDGICRPHFWMSFFRVSAILA